MLKETFSTQNIFITLWAHHLKKIALGFIEDISSCRYYQSKYPKSKSFTSA